MSNKKSANRLPQPFRYRGRWRGQVTLSNGMRPHADFDEFREAAAWITDTLANANTEKTMLLGGPTQATLCDMFMHYLEHYSLAKGGAEQEINRANHYLAGAGRPEMAVVRNPSGQKLLVTAAEAQRIRAEKHKTKASSAAGQNGGNIAGETPGSFVDHNRQRVQSHPRTYALYAELAKKTASRISKDDMSKLHSAMTTEGYAASTIQKEIALLKSMFNVARENWEWKGFENPCIGIKLQKGATRFVVLSQEQRERIRTALAESGNPEFWPFVELVLQSTQRKDSLLKLDWSLIDLENRIMRVWAKGDWADVPLSLHAVALLNNMPGEHMGRVFSMTENTVDCAWDVVRIKAGVPKMHFHDLRHVGGTDYARLGLNAQQLMRTMAHKTTHMADIYVNLTNIDVLEAMDRLQGATPTLPPSGVDRSSIRVANKAKRLLQVKRIDLEEAPSLPEPPMPITPTPAPGTPAPSISSRVVQFPVHRARAPAGSAPPAIGSANGTGLV